MPAATVVSSPGKVLLAGGYLVLDSQYAGVVVSTSSRFYTVVSDLARPMRAGAPIQIRVRSPQFVAASHVYAVRLDGPAVRVEPAADDPTRNKFVQLALERTLLLAQECTGTAALSEALAGGLDIQIVGDNDFYSQRAQLALRNLRPTLQSLAQLPPFLHTGVRLADVHKTGLGSSAALITSLVAALLLRLHVVPADAFAADAGASAGRRLAHNAAQYVHCLAQGKVGSGFDVSSAVFGSQRYTRFGPRVLAPLMADDALTLASSGVRLASVLAPDNPAWDHRVEPFRLPPSTRLMLADVDAGSDTPSLVGKVLKWRKEKGDEANRLWDALNESNQTFYRTVLGLTQLHAANPSEYAIVVKYLSTLQYVQWLAHPNIPDTQLEIIQAFSQVRRASEDIRAKMREMSALAGVPIEPPEQTALLDACVSVAGVIGGGVPGAGGYDAIWLLVFDPADCPDEERPSRRAEALWSSWKGLDVSPLSAGESTGAGVRVEALSSVPGLEAAIAGAAL